MYSGFPDVQNLHFRNPYKPGTGKLAKSSTLSSRTTQTPFRGGVKKIHVKKKVNRKERNGKSASPFISNIRVRKGHSAHSPDSSQAGLYGHLSLRSPIHSDLFHFKRMRQGASIELFYSTNLFLLQYKLQIFLKHLIPL